MAFLQVTLLVCAVCCVVLGAPNPGLPVGGLPSLPVGGLPSLPVGGLPSLPVGGLPSLPVGGLPSLPGGGIPSLPGGGVPSLPGGGVPTVPVGTVPCAPGTGGGIIMPFKIIKTVEKGKDRLTIVPSGWEHNGILRWPGNNVSLKLLIKNDKSTPLPDWTKMECIVKRSSITTYNKAEEVLETMLNYSDTSDYPDDENKVILHSNVDYNSKASSLMSHQDVVQDSEVIPVGSRVFQIITNDNDIQLNNTDKILENQKEILDNQKSITNNQNIIHETQTQILEKLKKNSRQISDVTVLIEESFKRLAEGNQNLSVVKLAEANSIESESFVIKPISNAKELNELEINLSDQREKKKMHLHFALLCNKSDGSGISCAYKLLDIMFTREFLCKCSWSGGSKGQQVKVALKAYKNILNFFFSLISSWDKTYTHDTNEKFFKTVLKNSGKRLEIKNLRTSTKRTRKDSGQIKKRTKTTNVMEAVEVENNQQEHESDIIPNFDVQDQIIGNVDLEEASLC